jgi:hypothetical protein
MPVRKRVWSLAHCSPITRLFIDRLVTFHEEFTITFKPQRLLDERRQNESPNGLTPRLPDDDDDYNYNPHYV